MLWDQLQIFRRMQCLIGSKSSITSHLLFVIRTSVWGLSDDDLSNPAIKAKIAELDKAIIESVDIPLGSVMPLPVEDVLYSDDDELTAPVNVDLASLEYHDVTPEELDEY
jgi:hypothetical protein